MRTRTSSLRHADGYTLIELLIVLMVMFILVGMAAPALGSYVNQQRVRRALDTVIGDIYSARMYAVKERRTVQVNFGPGAAYRVDTLNSAGTAATWRSATLNNEFIGVTFPSSGAVTMIRFDARGLIGNLTSEGYIKVIGRTLRDSAMVSPAGRVYRAQ